MTDPDYKIEELFDPENMRVYFVVISMIPTPRIIGPQFDTLEEAKECVRMCRKWKYFVACDWCGLSVVTKRAKYPDNDVNLPQQEIENA